MDRHARRLDRRDRQDTATDLRRPDRSAQARHGQHARDGRHVGDERRRAQATLLGGDAGDVNYPYYLINGRIPAAPTTFSAKPGQRIRIRIINAGSDTAFRVAMAGHSMTVTHTDGYPFVPTEVDAVLLGMGERYDVIVTAGDGVFPLVALAEGKNALARALLSTGAGRTRPGHFSPPNSTSGSAPSTCSPPHRQVDLGSAKPDANLSAVLSGDMMHYNWTINGEPFTETNRCTITQGQRAVLTFNNISMMWHPMHLHGHTFQIDQARRQSRRTQRHRHRAARCRKSASTLIADNPGIWMLHCHNTYHQEAGMMTSLNYVS